MVNTTGDPEDFQVQLFGDTAVANFRTKWDDNFDAQHHAAYSRLTEIYQRRHGKWLLISRQETDIPFSAVPPAPAHPELLPLSENWFFIRNDAGTYEFVRDRSGKVIAHRLRDYGGDIMAEKIR